MSLGTGYEYLLRSVVRGDGAVPASSPLTRYYADSGTPPGYWLGAGLAGIGLVDGSEVAEEQLFRLLGMLEDPTTGEPLGRRPGNWPTPLAQRIRLRVAALPSDLDAGDRADRVRAIEAQERERDAHIARPVAGFDLTFSVPKSVSTVWAIADSATQEVIHQAHRDAINVVLAYAEQNILLTRTGAGGSVQLPIRGVIAAAFDHWESRSGDPHLHTHVVIANRVQGPDGTWRSLDARVLYAYVVALSEMHEGVVQDLLSDRLGYAWEERARKHSNVPRWEIAGVPQALIEEFSSRSRDIETAKNALVAEFVDKVGRQPSNVEVLRLRQQATLRTRPDKRHSVLAEQAETWRDRSCPFVGGDTVAAAHELTGQNPLPALTGAALDADLAAATARAAALATVAAKRATFTRANVLAEVHRQLHGARFATGEERLAIADRMTATALGDAIVLTPDSPNVATVRYTSAAILQAESRLLDAGRSTAGPRLSRIDMEPRHRLGADQQAAVTAIATSGRELDLLVGPAGSGKTSALAALRRSWEDTFGPGSVIGLAPSAAAAEVLAAELSIPTENTAKWLHESARQNDRLDRIADLYAREQDTESAAARESLRTQARQIYREYER
jgi:conjugative relaxase-like TrwC/TraI family protein